MRCPQLQLSVELIPIGKLKSDRLLPNVLTYQEAVRFVLDHHEFYRPDGRFPGKIVHAGLIDEDWH